MAMVTHLEKRISDPLQDRIDIHVEVPRLEYDRRCDDRPARQSETILPGRNERRGGEGDAPEVRSAMTLPQ